MSEYLRPQSPIYSKENDAYIYPLTTSDQVILPDGSRLNNENLRSYGYKRNLLDNSDFTNPVNQRGQTSYESYFATTFDRWLIASESQDPSVTATVSKTSDGLKFRAASNGKVVFGQRLPVEALSNNKTYTAVACKSDGTLIWGEVGDYVETFGFWSINFNISDNDVLVWAALYEGEYTAETLPAYQPKGYGAELAECMRYYQKSAKMYSTASDISVVPGVRFPIEMRTVPTVTIYDNDGNPGAISRWTSAEGIKSVPATVAAAFTSCIWYLNASDCANNAVAFSYTASADL